MIRSVCAFEDKGKRCNKVTRARRIHKFCRAHTLEITKTRRAVPHQIKKVKVVKIKHAPVVIEKKRKK